MRQGGFGKISVGESQQRTKGRERERELLNHLLQPVTNANNTPKAIQLICNICIDFGIFDLVLWEKVLERLQQYGAVRDCCESLNSCSSYPSVHAHTPFPYPSLSLFAQIYYLLGLLEHVTSIPELSLLKSLPTLWNNAMVSSLEYFKSQLTVDVFTPAHCSVPTDDCEHPQLDLNLFNRIISLIQKCPFLSEIDLPRFHSLFTGLMMNKDHRYSYHLALLGLAALPPSMECRRLISVKKTIMSRGHVD